MIGGRLRALQNPIVVTVLLHGEEYCMSQELAARGWGTGSDYFLPSANALLAACMNINSSAGGSEGSLGLPLTPDVATARSSVSVLMKRRQAMDGGGFTVWRQVVSQATVLQLRSLHKDSMLRFMAVCKIINLRR